MPKSSGPSAPATYAEPNGLLLPSTLKFASFSVLPLGLLETGKERTEWLMTAAVPRWPGRS